jgi:hypothetical protein
MIFPLCDKLGQTIIFVRTRETARNLHRAVRCWRRLVQCWGRAVRRLESSLGPLLASPDASPDVSHLLCLSCGRPDRGLRLCLPRQRRSVQSVPEVILALRRE